MTHPSLHQGHHEGCPLKIPVSDNWGPNGVGAHHAPYSTFAREEVRRPQFVLVWITFTLGLVKMGDAYTSTPQQ
jgi:hypothetical protein